MRGSWTGKVGRFLISFGILSVTAVALGFALLSPEGQRGLLIAISIAFGVQFLSVAVLASLRAGSTGYLLARALAGAFRFVIVALAAFALAGREGVDLVVAMLTLVGLLFVLLIAESWMLREPGKGMSNG